MTDDILSSLSGETKACIILTEFRLHRQSMAEICRIFHALIDSDLERIGIIEMIRRQAPGLGIVESEVARLVRELEAAPANDTNASPDSSPMSKTIRVHRFDPTESDTSATAHPTTFNLRPHVPAADAPKADPHFGDPRYSEGGAFSARPGGDAGGTKPDAKRILIADDDTRIRMVFRKRLEDNGYRVTEVADGQSAWEKLQHERYDAAILDMKMPGLHGLEVLDRLTKKNADLPVVICSAYEQLQGEFVIATYPKLRFLVKPVPMDKLVATVNELTAASE